MKTIRWKVIFKSIFSFSIFSSLTFVTAHAELSHYDLKGVHRLIAPEYQEFSPVYGFTLLGTKSLENRRFYGNYGAEIKDERTLKGKLLKKGIGCLGGDIGEILRKNQDCPQDSMSELIQRLFPSQDGVNFVANQIHSDLVSHLEPKTLGLLLGRLSLVKEGELASEKAAENLVSDLTRFLFRSLNPEGFAKKEEKQRKKESPSCLPRSQSPGVDLEKIAVEMIEACTSSDSDDDSSRNRSSRSSSPVSLNVDENEKKGKNWKEKDCKEFATLLVNALKESHEHAYPVRLAEHALLSYFWKKANHKEDFLHLLDGMSEINPKILVQEYKDVFAISSPHYDSFLSEKYQASDFNPAPLLSNPAQAAEDLLQNPEKMAFYAAQDLLSQKPFPPIVSYGSAKHSALEGGTYPDCGETSLRNFLNIALFNPKEGRFDPQYLESLKTNHPDINIHPGLSSFYKSHPDPGLAASQVVRDAWSEQVAAPTDSKQKHERVTRAISFL